MLPPGARAVGDRRHPGQRPEAVAVVDERLRAEGDRSPGGCLEGVPEGGDERMLPVEEEGVADELIIEVDGRARLVREVGHEGPKLPLDLGAVGPRHPASGPFEPAGLRELIVDLAGVDLPDKDAGAGGEGDGVASRGEARVEATEA